MLFECNVGGKIEFNPYDYTEFLNGYVVIDSTLNSTQIDEGALVVGGGVGIANDVWIGGTVLGGDLVGKAGHARLRGSRQGTGDHRDRCGTALHRPT